MSLLINGAGYSGKAIARAASASGITVAGTTRSQDRFSELEAAGINPLLFDGTSISPEHAEALRTARYLVQSVAPGKDGDPLLRLIGGDLRTHAPALEWVCYLSTVGVYGDHDGAWVDESAECRPVSVRSVERVAAEQAWQEAAGRAGLPLAILRLSGIYGPGRNALCNLEKGTARHLIKPGQVFNRIRVEDIGAACIFLLNEGTGGIFNITDDEPAPPQDVVVEAARLMGVQAPPEQDFASADLTPMARSFYGENKRVSNAAIRARGFSFTFPEYRTSIAQLWESGRWRG